MAAALVTLALAFLATQSVPFAVLTSLGVAAVVLIVVPSSEAR